MLLGASGRARRLPGALRKDKAARPAPRDSGCRAVQSPPGAEELHLDWQQRFETADIDGCGTAPCAGALAACLLVVSALCAVWRQRLGRTWPPLPSSVVTRLAHLARMLVNRLLVLAGHAGGGWPMLQ